MTRRVAAEMPPAAAGSAKMRTQIVDAWWLIALSIAAGVSGQAAIKLGIGRGAPAGAGNGPVQLVMTILHSPLILLGLGLYALGVGVDRRVGQAGPELCLPVSGLNFVLITLVAQFGRSKVLLIRWVGVAIICAGIFLIARSGFDPVDIS
ncbi:MAG: hypothetical protein R3A10_16645 [Caldilineaceae bacterium]